MEAELILDGLFTHNNFKGCMNPIHAKRIGKALSAVKSARDILRNDMKSKQPTLTTRGSIKSNFNRHHLWECNAVPEWQCDCDKPFNSEGHKITHKSRKEASNKKEKEKQNVSATLQTLPV
jgi:hypothetical protein